MVVSKRCKICAVIDTNNVPITGEYFNKNLPETIVKICGVQLDPRKASSVLICQPCIIQIIHTEMVIEKLQNAVQRLKRNVKANHSKSIKEATTDGILNTPKKIVRRKSMYSDGKLSDTIDERIKNGEAFNVDTSVKKSVRRKSVKPDGMLSDPNKGNNQNGMSVSVNTSINESPKRKRKAESSTINSVLLVNADIDKTEEPPTDLTVEQDGNDTNNETVMDHFGEKSRNCILCDEVFRSKKDLRGHIQTAHIGERVKSCPHCFSEFQSKQKYETHVSSEKCKAFDNVCQVLNCNKRFKTVHKMELHVENNH